MEPSLDDLAHKYGTEKVTHGYMPHFELVLAPFRNEAFDMLEIGVKQGASIRMWHEYFPAARIVGVDARTEELEDNLPRFTFVRGNQANMWVLQKLILQYKFRLIVDDGSHLWGHQIFTFETLFPWLEPGGVYICEDIQTSYGEYVDRYQAGAQESAAAYFFRVAQTLTAGEASDLRQTQDPLLYCIVKKIRRMIFIRHCVIIMA